MCPAVDLDLLTFDREILQEDWLRGNPSVLIRVALFYKK